MEIKALEFKKYKHKSFEVIINGRETFESIRFEKFELNSILSLLFSVEFHFPLITDDNKKDVNYLIYEKQPLFNVTRDFGRNLIESLDGHSKDWLVDIQSKAYTLKGIFRNSELVDFVQTALIDFLPIRSWEYGRFFTRELSNYIFDSVDSKYKAYEIKRKLEGKDDYLDKIADEVMKSKTKLGKHEQIILLILLKENLFKSKMTIFDYFLISNIVKENIINLSQNTANLKLATNEVLANKLNNNNNKGRRPGR